MRLACASMLFSTNSATALSGLLCESAMMRIAFQSSPILSLPRALLMGAIVLHMRGRRALPSEPALGSDPRHAGELAQIVGDDDQSFAAGMAADLHVMRPARRASPLQLRPNLSVMRSRLVGEGQHIETRHEVRYGGQGFGAARRPLPPLVQIAER